MLADGMCEAKISCNAITEETASLASSEVIADGRFKRTGDDGGLRKRRKRQDRMRMRMRMRSTVKCSLGEMIYVIYHFLCVSPLQRSAHVARAWTTQLGSSNLESARICD